jgi:threonine aldolase
MNFASDNVTPAAPEILEALARGNEGAAMPYGADAATERLEPLFAELFETEVKIFPVATGTAANVLSLAVMTPPYGAIYCHRESHINSDECGAPELYTGGAKLVAMEGAHGKITADDLAARLAGAGAGDVHHVQPAAISITQASEAGTVYTADEIAAIGDLARSHGLGLHMDGARFANAVAALGCAPADITWRAGVDALSFGATKNGALAAEAIVLFKPELAETMGYRRKRGGHLFSKMRALSLQLEAYLEGGRWLAFARHANEMAAELASGLDGLAGVAILHPVEANEIFLTLPAALADGLLAEGFMFYRWGDEAVPTARLVTGFDTKREDVRAFIATAARLAGDVPAGRKRA